MTIPLRRFLDAIQYGEALPHGQLEEVVKFNSKFTGEIIFKNVDFKESVFIKAYKNTFPLRFIKCTFEKGFIIDEKTELELLEITDCSFNSNCTIKLSIIKDLTLKETYFKDGIRSSDLFSDSLRIELLTSNNAKFTFHKPNLSYCSISKMRDSSDLIFSSFNTELNVFESAYIKGLFCNCDSEYSGMMLIYGPEIDILTLNGYNKSGRLMFQDLTVGNLTGSQFTNAGMLSLANIKGKLPLMINLYRSNLGKCELYDIDFTTFTCIKIDNSNLQEIVPTNIQWCSKIESSLTGLNRNDHLRETYRQLKNVMIRQNDKVMELSYHRLEMDKYLESIFKKKGYRADRFILWTNKISNNHGLSYIQPLVIILIIALVTFVGNNLLLGLTCWEWHSVPKNIALYFESINPVRKFSAIYPESKIGIKANFALLFDVIFRLLASYLIFQFISAFRKYVKK